jgi:RND family efflux transporter MFP subunit
MWLQLLLSLLVIVIAVGVAALLNPTANDLVKRIGIGLPLLTGSVDQAPAAAPQAQGQGRQGQGAGQQQAAAPGQGGGQRQGQGGAGRGGFGGGRTAVVVTAPVASGTINNQLTSIGEGSAIRSVTVNSAQGGTLMSIDVKPGDKVEAGARIATLDSGSQQIAYDKAQLASQDADAALARARSLAKSNAVSDAQVAAAQLAASQAQLALNDAKLALDQRTITTPIAGTVGLIQVTPGNLINAQTVVTTVEDDAEILVNFWVPERYSSQISVGEPVTATSAALAGESFAGTVSAVDNRIDPDSRTLQIQATLPNPDNVIRAGMSFSVEMAFPGETFTSVDPLSIQWSNNGAYVWKVVDGKASKAIVDIIQRNSDGVLVKGDVKEGDAVVTQGVLQLSDGLAVRLLDAPQAADGDGGQGKPAGGQAGGVAKTPSQAAPAAGG